MDAINIVIREIDEENETGNSWDNPEEKYAVRIMYEQKAYDRRAADMPEVLEILKGILLKDFQLT